MKKIIVASFVGVFGILGFFLYVTGAFSDVENPFLFFFGLFVVALVVVGMSVLFYGFFFHMDTEKKMRILRIFFYVFIALLLFSRILR